MKAWNNSKCINQWFHRFKIVFQIPQGVLEQCEICHKRKFFKMVQGRTNNMEYIAYHNRQCLPREHNNFKREYNK